MNTIPIQQFIQQVKSAELSQQREIKIDIKSAKTLVYCMAEITAKLTEDYDKILSQLQSSDNDITIQFDGGGFSS